MTAVPLALGLGVVVLAVALGLRTVTANRFVKRRLRLTIALSAIAVVLTGVLAAAVLPAELADRARSLASLVLALAVVNLVVVAGVNPWRADRVPDRFPTIVQDAAIVGLFVLVATVMMQEKFLTTSAVGAVVVGFALQDTLGNAFAGLAIQSEKPFHVGQWIRIGEHEGCVAEITWRATKLRTKAHSFVVVPNNVMSREAIVNYSEPVVPTRLQVEVGATYLVPPNEVKAAMLEAVANAPLALKDPPPDVLLMEFGNSAITYRARFWVEDYGRDEVARDQVRTGIYYGFRRRGIEIPWPIQVEYTREEPPARSAGTTDQLAELLGRVDVLRTLSEAERLDLAARCDEVLYARGEAVVRQGEAGASMFVVRAGRLAVTLDPGAQRVATIESGGFFGEMSLLTGEARTATVTAETDCRLMEITVAAFRDFVLAKPAVLERVGLAVIGRRAELDRARASAGAVPGGTEPVPTFMARVRRFLRITG